LALGEAANRGPSAARQAVAEVVSEVLDDIDGGGKLRPPIREPAVGVPAAVPAARVKLGRARSLSVTGTRARSIARSPRTARRGAG
jgi:hypothetical protein